MSEQRDSLRNDLLDKMMNRTPFHKWTNSEVDSLIRVARDDMKSCLLRKVLEVSDKYTYKKIPNNGQIKPLIADLKQVFVDE